MIDANSGMTTFTLWKWRCYSHRIGTCRWYNSCDNFISTHLIVYECRYVDLFASIGISCLLILHCELWRKRKTACKCITACFVHIFSFLRPPGRTTSVVISVWVYSDTKSSRTRYVKNTHHMHIDDTTTHFGVHKRRVLTRHKPALSS